MELKNAMLLLLYAMVFAVLSAALWGGFDGLLS